MDAVGRKRDGNGKNAENSSTFQITVKFPFGFQVGKLHSSWFSPRPQWFCCSVAFLRPFSSSLSSHSGLARLVFHSQAQHGPVEARHGRGRRGKPCEESIRSWKESEDGNVRKSLLSSYPICTAQCEVHSSALKSELDLMSHKHFSILLVIFNHKFETYLSCIDI